MFKKALLALAFLAPLSQSRAQVLHAPVVWVADSVRAQLKEKWDNHNPNQPERAYCGIVEETEYTPGTSQYTLIAVLPSRTDSTSAYYNRHACPKDMPISVGKITLHFTDLHTHVPTTCDENQKNCQLGGGEAWECFPSSADYGYLLDHHFKVAFIQCSAEAIVPYFETAYTKK